MDVLQRLRFLVLACKSSFIPALFLLLISGCKLETVAAPGGQVSFSLAANTSCKPTQGTQCGLYDPKQTVEVIANADTGYEFTGWEGDCKGMGFCTLAMNSNRFVRANFAKTEDLILHDTANTTKEILEHGNLVGSCDRWAKNPAAASNYLEKMCGKWMFFYEGFNIEGVPAAVANFMVNNLPQTVGKGFSQFGMIPDPYSKTNLPLGLAPGATIAGVKTLSFACASCHFAKTPDGRFSAGLSNHDYDYGKQIIALNFISPAAMLPASLLDKQLDPLTINYMQPILDEINANNLKGSLFASVIPLAGLVFSGTPLPTIPKEVQRQYLSWKKGTQDFVITPVGADDQVETISKMVTLWNLYSDEEMRAAGGPHSMLGFTGSTPNLDEFLAGFVALSQGNFPTERLKALKTYLLTLKAPSPNIPQNNTQVENGRQLFSEKGCADCHNGPSFSSTRVFSFEEIGTDAALKRWADPDLDGISNVPQIINEPLTHSVKAPRLVGMWAQKLFLHNGSVDSLEDLFCLNHARPTRTDEPFGDQGHTMTCENLSDEQKLNLIAYLKTL